MCFTLRFAPLCHAWPAGPGSILAKRFPARPFAQPGPSRGNGSCGWGSRDPFGLLSRSRLSRSPRSLSTVPGGNASSGPRPGVRGVPRGSHEEIDGEIALPRAKPVGRLRAGLPDLSTSVCSTAQRFQMFQVSWFRDSGPHPLGTPPAEPGTLWNRGSHKKTILWLEKGAGDGWPGSPASWSPWLCFRRLREHMDG